MTPSSSRSVLTAVAAGLGLSPDAAARVVFEGDDRLPSCFGVTELAAASIGAAGLAVSELVGLEAPAPDVSVDQRLASLWFGFSIRPVGWEMPGAWDPIAGDYRTRNGWIKLHTNAPHHRAAALRILGCEASRDAVAAAVATWDADDLEGAIVATGGCAARLRSREAWTQHEQGRAVAAEPLVHRMLEGAPPTDWRPNTGRPLAGIRVLDLTRVLAGPVATRFLAGYGADVLRVDPPDWDEPGVVPEVTLGKRCTRLDLRDAAARSRFEQLVSEADILIHGYRADALERLGYGAAFRRARNPGLIDVSLDAYGHTGPWALRRGFDSLVQFSTGIAAEGMAWRSAEAPVSLPVQALDHATGYLIAAAAVRGVTARQRGEGATRARLSLARTAELLFAHRGDAAAGRYTPPGEADLSEGVEATSWGSARRLWPPMQVGGAPMAWALPAGALGRHEAAWA